MQLFFDNCLRIFPQEPRTEAVEAWELKERPTGRNPKRVQKISQFFVYHVPQLLDHCMGDVQCCGSESSISSESGSGSGSGGSGSTVWWRKIEKNTAEKLFYLFLLKIAIYFSLGLHKGRPSYRGSLHYPNFSLFLWVIFALLDPDPIQIRIRNTGGVKEF